MQYRGTERRKYQRFDGAIPGLIALKGEKTPWAQFRGETTDISMDELGLELSYPASGMFPFGTRMIGENREFDLQLVTKLGTKDVSGVGEVRWTSKHFPSRLKMGVFLKEMGHDEKKKWTDFLISQSRGNSQGVS